MTSDFCHGSNLRQDGLAGTVEFIVINHEHEFPDPYQACKRKTEVRLLISI
jgi:hypothetical protein